MHSGNIALGRRHFLGTGLAASLGIAAGLPAWQQSLAAAEGTAGDPPAERPRVSSPRATSGDEEIEPNWDERLTVTIGQQDAQIVGRDDKALQAAVDYVTRYGGGTVRILPGTYKLRNAVWLNSKVRLLGSGEDTILIKEAMLRTPLAVDSDWYDQEVTLQDAKGFQVGDGICLRCVNPHNQSPTVIKRTLVARSGNRFKLDRPLRENLWKLGEAYAATLFPILTGENISQVAIQNLVLDGNRANNDLLDGNHAGGIFLQDCRKIDIRGVTSRNYHGDGISWQICHDVTVEHCRSHNNSGLGLHPGSGSQRPVMRFNKLEQNDIGLFFCWGVKYGLAEKNEIRDNRGSGVSIGHRDTDNIVRDNDIIGSGKVGVLFRPERGQGFSADRNLIENNRIVDSGDASGVAVDVQGFTTAVQLKKNSIRETRGAQQRVAIRLGANAGQIDLAGNEVDGFAKLLDDQRKSAG